jgi:exodeoxyribonuclease V alpha subunit
MKQFRQNLEKFSGSVERVTFHSTETGFCVLKTKVKGRRELVTVIGNAANITGGEYIECAGYWVNNTEHGMQFKAEQLKVLPPTTLEGIQKYLGSGLIKGIGPHFAKVLIKAFGDEVFDVIESSPKRLLKLPGIGEKRQTMILTAWAEQKIIRNIMIFLQSHGVGTARAVRIYKTYGDNAIDVIRDNPYRLALDVFGIGFKSADAIAMQIGIAKDSIKRAQAGIRHVLQEFAAEGNCAVQQHKLIEVTAVLLESSHELVMQAITYEVQEGNIILEQINNENFLFLAALYQAEVLSAKSIARIKCGKCPWDNIDYEKALYWVNQQTGITLSPSQSKAVMQALKEKVIVITGGPGVGKTTIIKCIIKIVAAKHTKILLCAPTGRAAKRLSEATSLPAKTIHRLLEYDPRTHAFKHHQSNQLKTDLIIIDEFSMVDIVLWYNLVRAIPQHAALIIVGDIDQLPSVGPGNVLADIINSKVIPVVRLSEIFRQAAASQIIINAHRINEGTFYPQTNTITDNTDFYFIKADSPEDIQTKLLSVVTTRIPQRFGYDPLHDIQVLTPMNRGGLGSRSLNVTLQATLNPTTEPKISKFGYTFAPGDKIIQNINNYDKDVFNGDIGFIISANLEESSMQINFDGKIVEYSFNELDEISLAYATTIHKSQGSEYPVVVIPICMQHYMLLARNLIYTAVTRGKKLVVVIGQQKALAIAVKNISQKPRITNLRNRLEKEFL